MASLPLQAMDLTSLRAVLAELRPVLLPSRFEKARQADGHTLQLGFRSLTGRHWLELSWLAEAPRLLAVDAPPRGGDGSTLAQQLQHGLAGLALVGLEQHGWERVVELQFATRPGEAIRRSLVVELMGRHSNLFLLDAERRVVAAARQVREQQSRLRPIGTGDPYSPPPPLGGMPPSRQESREHWQAQLQLLPLPLGQALRSAYQGISPALALQLAGEDRSSAQALLATGVDQLGEGQWQQLWQRWQRWLETLEEERFVVQLRGPTPYCCWPAAADSAGPEAAPPLVGASAELPINRALAQHHHSVLEARQLQQRRQGLELKLRQALARESAQRQALQQRLDQVESCEALQRQADALLCLLRPSRDEVAEAQSLYKRARKLRRSVAAITPRLAEHDGRISQLEASLTYLEQTEQSRELLQALEEEGEVLLHERSQRRRQRRSTGNTGNTGGGAPGSASAPNPLELTSPGGLRLQVGRNHRQNEWISLRQARRGDLWFHAQECPGSHVVLKSSEGPASEPDLQAAADLAAHFSRARGNSRVAVVMVPSEALQRIPGSGPGTVRHRGGEVLWAEPSRAAALLAPPVHSLGRDPQP
ncbi:MAG: Rqc2 family fibronectin-binding protein [Vulcanococcus sp.]